MNVLTTRLLLSIAVILTGVFSISCRGTSSAPAITRVSPPTPRPLNAAPTVAPPTGASYYVDSVGGSDKNSGRSPDSPWQTLDKVSSFKFNPGDVVGFKRGSSWSGGLVLQGSGAAGNPIVFRDYGTGPRPVFSNPGQKSVITIAAHWLVIQGLQIQDAQEAGIRIEKDATDNVVRDNELTNVGIGVGIYGRYNRVTGNYAHDLHMVVDTPQPTNDDYGAVGFWIQDVHNEVSYNRCVNCRAPSHDYGYDGGVVEIYDNGDYSYIHHNYGTGSQGFLEIGRGSAQNVRVAYNISDNNYDGFACIHTGDNFTTTVQDFEIVNNTIVKTMNQGEHQFYCIQKSIQPTELLFFNNIVYSSIPIGDGNSFMHAHNLYFMTNGAAVGFDLGPGERVADPLFVNMDAHDYHLSANSPAVRAGLDLGYPLDFDDKPLPRNAPPDIGALEFGQ